MLPVKVGEDDETGMDLLSGNQVAEITGILGDKDKVPVDAPVEDLVIRFPEPSDIPHAGDDVTEGIERVGHARGDALVKEQAHVPAGIRRSTFRGGQPQAPMACRKDVS